MSRKPVKFTVSMSEIEAMPDSDKKRAFLDRMEQFLKPAYEQHPTAYPAKGIDEAGTLIRTRPPVFSCDYSTKKNDQIPSRDLQVYDMKTGMHFYGMRVENEADYSTEYHKQYAMMHAASWLILENSGKLPRPADEMEALRRYERIITGAEDLPAKAKDDPDSIPF